MTPEQLLAAANAATQASAGATDFEGDETPVVAVNRPLLEAYNAMWDASRSLEVGEPGAALPPMRAALARDPTRAQRRAAVSARQGADGDRRHREGAPRGQARRRGLVVANPARRARQLGRASRRSASMRAVSALASNPAAAIDSLLALRVDALESAPELAGALAPAIDSLRAGHDATSALVRARRIAAGATVARIDVAAGRRMVGGVVSSR